MSLQHSLTLTAHDLTLRPARRLVLQAARAVRKGRLILTLPDGSQFTFGGASEGPVAHLTVKDERVFSRLLFSGEMGLGESYMDGLWEVNDLTAFLTMGIVNRENANPLLRALNTAARFPHRRLHRARRNSRSGSRRNVAHHYDLSNDFFALMLDETMAYSCALFERDDQSLDDAQRNKFALICQKAGLRPDERLLEIGCGWGGFARFAAAEFGAVVTGATISREQLVLARQLTAEAGLERHVGFELTDYRDLQGSYDKIVSIEMFEAVGAEYFEAFFRRCDSLLRRGGRLVLQTISVPDRLFPGLRDGVNWMQKYIFPGGMLPSLAQIEQSIARTSLVITDVEDIGLHYVRTLQEWRSRFFSNLGRVRDMGFDERFVRMWHYYLCSAEAGFATRSTGDLQIVFEKP
jgi:cyclopropane-fatty-acyl-phospholipid synthase